MLQSIHTTETAVHQLCIHPTGGDKSHLFTTLAACLGQITLCITPLLSLGVDQTFKHQNNTKSNSTELNSPLHLDEVTKSEMKLPIDCCQSTAPSFSIIVYASLQSLVTKKTGLSDFLKFLLLGHPNLLSMIVIDKIHLLTDFGRSFRSKFQMFKNELFQKVKDTKLILFLTATCSGNLYSINSHFLRKFNWCHMQLLRW